MDSSAVRSGSPAMDPERIQDAAAVQTNIERNRLGAKAERNGILTLQLKDFSAAEKYLTQKLAVDPADWKTYRLRALSRREQQNHLGAYRDATKALELNPGDDWSYDIRALAQLDMHRYADALDDTERALAINPRNADTYQTRALVYERMGKPGEMLSNLKQAAALNPQFEALYRQMLREHGGQGRDAGSPRRPWTNYGAGLLAAVLLAVMLSRKPKTQRGDVLAAALRPDLLHEQSFIKGFEIMRKIGRGGMGEVYEALDTALQRKVAIKKMLFELSSDPRERKRFLKEARIVASLKHPNIVEIHSMFEEQDNLYLVFEYVDGDSLAALLSRNHSFDFQEVGNLLNQISTALDHAHARGIIHRDLKPSNIMTTNGFVKVMDFGIAHRLQSTMTTRSMAEIVGTPAYMAPEQEQGITTQASDIYALGICSYELLSGRPPYNGEGLRQQKLARSFQPLSRLVPGLPAEIDPILHQALDPDPGKRFQRAGDLSLSLRGLLPLALSS